MAKRTVHTLSFLTLALGVVAASAGVFIHQGGAPYDFVNQYGDKVEIYGKGLYAHDSTFKAPIFRGTDLTMLFVACPLLFAALMYDFRNATLKSRLQLTSLIACFFYYAASIAFGVAYNALHLVYIALFSVSLYGLIAAMTSIDRYRLVRSVLPEFPLRGMYVFLILTGLALFGAWLPDIMQAFRLGRPLLLIETYTTEITYVLDMGLVAPAAFICIYLLKKRAGLGYILLDIFLTLCLLMGIMLPVQTLFQFGAGIAIPPAALAVKMGVFCLLAVWAALLKWNYYKNLRDL
ncbi:MAG: hypothetical protein H6565_01515 [Lewinellaceae bacterium]|nr:hypothetical protein [Lewinellaceae bacterium]